MLGQSEMLNIKILILNREVFLFYLGKSPKDSKTKCEHFVNVWKYDYDVSMQMKQSLKLSYICKDINGQ